MGIGRQGNWLDVLSAVLLWLLLGVGVELFRIASAYGAAGWPLPLIEGLAAEWVVRCGTATGGLAWPHWYWLPAYPLAGILWVSLLTLTGPYFARVNHEFAYSLQRFAFTSLPVVASVPYTTVVLMQAGALGDWRALRAGVLPPPLVGLGHWSTYAMVALCVLALVWHLLVYRSVFGIGWRGALRHLFTSVLLLVCVAGFLAGLGGWLWANGLPAPGDFWPG